MTRLPLEKGRRPSRRERFSVQVVETGHDPEWDSFLAHTPAGHPAQTCSWARAKAVLGWRSVRIILREGGTLVAGGQLLLLPIPLIGSLGFMGYLAKGPVVAPGYEQTVPAFLQELKGLARNRRILYCAVQPPENSTWDPGLLMQHDFQPSLLELAPTATVRFDLTQDEHVLLARMKSKARYNIRHGLRKGVQVREATMRDLGTFYRLLQSTAHRQNFAPDSIRYLRMLGHQFGSNLKLFFAARDRETVATALVITHRDTAYFKRGAWSGKQGRYHPNEVLHWQIMRWAKTQGLRYYDLDGIQPSVARDRIQGRVTIPENADRVTLFKLNFGGDIIEYPQCYEYIYNRLIQLIYDSLGREKGLIWVKDKYKQLHSAMARSSM